MNKISIRTICFVGMLTAIISVLSIISIPTPWGVPFTLQTFAVALAGYTLGMLYGTVSTVLYVIIGTIGVPVFSGMTGGPAKLFGPTGGYIYGFIFMAFLCGLAMKLGKKKKISGYVMLIVVSILALAACHIPGIIQLKYVALMGWSEAAMLGSVPYLLKDAISMAVAYFIALVLIRTLKIDKKDWK